jgi:hypothetical protein
MSSHTGLAAWRVLEKGRHGLAEKRSAAQTLKSQP